MCFFSSLLYLTYSCRSLDPSGSFFWLHTQLRSLLCPLLAHAGISTFASPSSLQATSSCTSPSCSLHHHTEICKIHHHSERCRRLAPHLCSSSHQHFYLGSTPLLCPSVVFPLDFAELHLTPPNHHRQPVAHTITASSSDTM